MNWGESTPESGDGFEAVFATFEEAFEDALDRARAEAKETGEPCPVTIHGEGTAIGKTLRFIVQPDGRVEGHDG